MPDELKRDFNEAREIVRSSPRGAAALLRLCVQKLCIHLGLPGSHIASDIACLEKRGLDTRIVQALHVVRVVGNEAVHPGKLDLRDDIETAEKLFNMINYIAHETITKPRQIEEMFGKLPETKRGAMQKGTSSK